MAERIGQYYFEVARNSGGKPEFVNRGKMIELDSRGEERFPWKRFLTTLAVGAVAGSSGGVIGIEVGGVISGIPPLEVFTEPIDRIHSGVASVSTIVGMFAGMTGGLGLLSEYRRFRLNRQLS